MIRVQRLRRFLTLPSFAPRILPAIKTQVTCEQGLSGALPGEKFAVIAHFSESPIVSRSVRRLVHEFAARAYVPVVVSACTSPDPLQWGGELPADAVVFRKPNVGYDFGSWAVGLAMLPQIATAPYVILANDSMVGPFAGLGPVLDKFESTAADAWGLTDSDQYLFHLQSYFLGFRGGILADKPLAKFWTNIRDERSKWNIILRNELALTPLLIERGYSVESAFPSSETVRPGENPVIRGWRELLDKGFPFVKREIIRDPSIAPGSAFVADAVYSTFGTDLTEWL